ncbi:MAG TPA: hypothetical protein DHV59_11550 [Oxalobacteraceae bacterium]|nr:hypothetical protein [Oxalobacteraceae bacterium]
MDGAASESWLAEAEARFRSLSTYRTTIQSTAADGERQVMRYSYRKPGWVRIEFIQPHKGLVLIYDPAAHKVRIWPFGLQRLPAPSLAPENPLLRGRSGQRIDHSDVGALLENLLQLRACGSVAPLDEMDIAGRPALGLDIAGAAGAGVAGVHRYHVWLARDSLFPLKVENFDVGERLIETVDMRDAEIDVPFPERFFVP